jgi:hypothetical protein
MGGEATEISQVNSPRADENKDECHGGSHNYCPESKDDEAGDGCVRNAEIRNAQV